MSKFRSIQSSRVLNIAFDAPVYALIVFVLLLSPAISVAQTNNVASTPPSSVMLQIIKAEDERRWGPDLNTLLSDSSESVRTRAAIAAGRIGDQNAVPALISMLGADPSIAARAKAAFALGEIESATAAEELVAQLTKTSQPIQVRARIIEALGKIAAALPRNDEARSRALGTAILNALDSELRNRPNNREVVLISFTAALRARPEGAGKVIALFLSDPDSRVRADAGNALARLRAGEGNEKLRNLLVNDSDPIVRANAARTLGATEDKASLGVLLDRAARDADLRVRVSAIRALASLRNPTATKPLLLRGKKLTERRLRGRPTEINEVLEIATALGRAAEASRDQDVVSWLRRVRDDLNNTAPEAEIALVRVSPAAYLEDLGADAAGVKAVQETLILHWKAGASIAQALGEIASLPDSTVAKRSYSERAIVLLRAMLDYRRSGIRLKTLVAPHPEKGIPDVLRAFALHKPEGLERVLQDYLKESDVIVRATAAELLGGLPPTQLITRTLVSALPQAMRDELNDAALAILDALGKQNNPDANNAIKLALESPDHLLRKRAATLLQANGVGDFSDRARNVQSRNTAADYERVVSRLGKRVTAAVSTSKGSFTIELLPDAAPLNVDNFIQLAKSGYFRSLTFHRVVPNFVIQGGDPRGDGNGGPGYQIRCEINEAPYERGAVGMALSGKDTGGSQWFVTHSPQPHLDGGYTVFGKVIAGMEVVDKITRGDLIRSITINEPKSGTTRSRRRRD
ncbi:MAG TPA: HEAT repeat domain-containing protein [Pyrinomonadaceae bacterium]|nr:HEAT repeat domain-containing protein [Pyrinomonadaceae bacterium]